MSRSSTSSSDSSAEGLILPLCSALGGSHRVTALLCTAVFLVATAGSGALDLWRPAPVPILKGREARDDAERRENAHVLDGSLMAVIDDDLNMRSNLAHHVVPWYTAAMVALLEEGTANMTVGQAGWLFDLARLAPGEVDIDRALYLNVNSIAALVRHLAVCGIEVSVLPIPRKSVIARERLPRGWDPEEKVDRRLIDALLERGVPTADLFSAWSDREPEEVYYQLDTHWTRLGQILAAEELCRAAGILSEPELRSSRIEDETMMQPRIGQLLTMGVPLEHPARQSFFPLEDTPRRRLTDREGNKISPYQVSSADGNWVAVGTSFTGGDNLVHYLSHFADRSFRNEGRLGESPLPQMEHVLLEKRAHRRPDRIVLEYPVYKLWLGNQLSQSARLDTPLLRIINELRPLESSLVISGSAFEIEEVTPGMTRALLGEAFLSSRGDGVVFLRVEGRFKRGLSKLTVFYGDTRAIYRLGQNTGDITVPLILGRSGAGELTIQVEDGDLEKVEIRSYHDLDAIVRFTPSPDVEDGKENLREFESSEPSRIRASDAVMLRFEDGINLPAEASVAIELVPDDEQLPGILLGEFPVGPGTLALVTVGSVSVGPVRAIRLRSATPAVLGACVEAGVVPLHVSGD